MNKFYTYLKLQGSQTLELGYQIQSIVLHLSEITRFSNQVFEIAVPPEVLHLSEITRFSNIANNSRFFAFVLHLSEITRFSNT